jgi:hypothetical protein
MARGGPDRQLASCSRQRFSGDAGVSAREFTTTEWAWDNVVHHPHGTRGTRISKHRWGATRGDRGSVARRQGWRRTLLQTF